ncbi:hypothetical protein DNTS_005922, partial [Danionella cerebrum]
TTVGPLKKCSNPEACRKPAYCYNCSKKGHFGHECSQKRMYNGSFPSLPFISYYDTPKDINIREHRMKKKAREMQEAGLISADGGFENSTPQPSRKKVKTSDKQSPYQQCSHKNNHKQPPKKRLAHSLKYPQVPQQNKNWNSQKQNSRTPWRSEKHTAHGAFNPQEQRQRGGKKKKSSLLALEEGANFPRSSKKTAERKRFHSSSQTFSKKPVRLFGTEKNNSKKKCKSKKKERNQRLMQTKAVKSSAVYPSDENLFEIKQKKGRRSK